MAVSPWWKEFTSQSQFDYEAQEAEGQIAEGLPLALWALLHYSLPGAG